MRDAKEENRGVEEKSCSEWKVRSKSILNNSERSGQMVFVVFASLPERERRFSANPPCPWLDFTSFSAVSPPVLAAAILTTAIIIYCGPWLRMISAMPIHCLP